jgi:hypothetical protein
MEEWKHIHGVEVSSLGRVRDRKSGIPFVPLSLSRGYIVLRIDNKNVSLHRLVCEAFHGPAPQKGLTVHHINVDNHDNRACNLRWATASEQSLHRNKFESLGAAKAIEVNFGSGWVKVKSIREACRRFGFTFCLVRDCLYGKQTHHKGARFRFAHIAEIEGEQWTTLESGVRVSNMGRFMNQSNGKIVTPIADDSGYSRFKGEAAHKLVAMGFLPAQPSPTDTIHHINRNRNDNRASNLRWATKQEQAIESAHPPKRRRKRAVAGTNSDGKRVSFESISDAARSLSLNSGHISACAKGSSIRKRVGGFCWEYV